MCIPYDSEAAADVFVSVMADCTLMQGMGKVLVVGASGLVGGALVRALEHGGVEVVGTYRSRVIGEAQSLDVRDESATMACLQHVRPTVVFIAINTPGGVDYCEEHPEEAYALNVRGTKSLVANSVQIGARVVYYSTDYVFDGKAGPYGEDDQPSPISVYGRLKWEAEQAVLTGDPASLVIRTTAVFGWAPGTRNFAMQVWERLSAGHSMRVPDDQWATPTLAEFLAEVSVRLVHAETKGIINVVGHDLLPRSEMGKALARCMMLDPDMILPVATVDLRQKAPRPLRAGLKTDRLERLLGLSPMGMKEALERYNDMWRADVLSA